jgi:digeranylgeranylglycerophospholipid reductase
MHDIVVCGGGPVGLYSARLLEERGFRVAAIEEHGRIGLPNHCSGLVSRRLEKFVPLDDFIEHEVRGAIIHSPRKSVKLEKRRTAAYVIDRERFDKSLAKGMKSEMIFGTKVGSVDFHGDFLEVNTDKGTFKSKALLGCDGANSVIRRQIGSRPGKLLNGIIAIESREDFSDYVELFFDRERLGDGFFWKIPRGATAEYGMMGSMVSFDQLERFFGIRDYEKRGGVINTGFCRTYSERTLLVGDAACQVKPWSGGGVIYGLTCARIAADTVTRAFERNDFSREFMRSYEREWRKAIGKQIRLGMLFWNAYSRIQNRHIDAALSLVGKTGLMNLLDMDLL